MTEREIFLAVLDLPDPAARAQYLDGACGGDPARRARIESLLLSHEAADSFLDNPAVKPPAPDALATQELGGEATPDDANDLQFLSPSARPDSLGRLGHYEMLQVLGKGGFGIVFRAFDEVLQRVVAVKVMAPQIATLSPARKRFVREARSSAAVRHENVVHVYEVGDRPLPYLVMEFVPGETLQQKLDRSGPLDVSEVLRIGRQIAEGLAAAHACDLIHRDIKPANILLEGGSQKVKITDFGLARAADDASISQSGVIAGTPMYMAPEQALGRPIDQRADLFSLGSLMYQIVSGRPPFRAPSALAVLKRVAEEAPRPIPEIIPETPDWLCGIIAKLHAKNPDERFQSAREVADVLADCEAQFKAHAKIKDFSRIPRGKPQRPGRWMWAAAAAALLVPMIALGVMEVAGVTHLFRGPQATPTDPSKPGGDPLPVVVVKQELLPPAFKNSIGMEFVIVPKGKSWLGGDKDKLGDQEVEIPADFYLGKYEVTQGEWQRVMGENPSYWSRTGGGKGALEAIPDAELKRLPVENVSWDQCQLFVAKLNKMEKETGWVYRLPKLAEWEYACRGGPMSGKGDSGFDFYFAKPTNTLLFERANFGGGFNRPVKVGSYEPNRLGLFDMAGNVQEWCQDSAQAATDDGKRFRGGSFRIGQCEAKGVAAAKSTFRGDDLGLRLARVPSGAPSPEAVTASQGPDLRAAEYVLSIGGTVKVNGEDRTIVRAADLPREFFQLRSVELRDNGRVTDAGLAVFENCTNLMSLNLGFTQVTDAGLAHFKNCKNLTALDLNTTRVTDAGLAHFKDCQDLRDIRLPSTAITDTGLAVFRNCKNLRILALGGCEKVTGSGLAAFKDCDCEGLLFLSLQVTGTTDSDLACFKGCKALTHLFLGGTKVSDAGLANFKDCKNLTDLWLNNAQVGDAGMVHFRDCKALRNVNLAGTKVSDVGLAHFKDCKNLKYLVLERTPVGDAGLAPFKGLPLSELNIDNTGITDLTPLQGMPLEHIYLTPKNITRGLDMLRDMKSLETIGLAWPQSWPAAEFWKRYDKGEFKE